MKLVTALSTAAFVLVPAVGLAQENGTGNTKQEEPGVVNKVIEKITGHDANKSDDANKSVDQDSTAKSKGSTDYPDFPAIKKTK